MSISFPESNFFIVFLPPWPVALFVSFPLLQFSGDLGGKQKLIWVFSLPSCLNSSFFFQNSCSWDKLISCYPLHHRAMEDVDIGSNCMFWTAKDNVRVFWFADNWMRKCLFFFLPCLCKEVWIGRCLYRAFLTSSSEIVGLVRSKIFSNFITAIILSRLLIKFLNRDLCDAYFSLLTC